MKPTFVTAVLEKFRQLSLKSSSSLCYQFCYSVCALLLCDLYSMLLFSDSFRYTCILSLMHFQAVVFVIVILSFSDAVFKEIVILQFMFIKS